MITLGSAANTRQVCEQSPIELGIVLDSSLSIKYRDFQTGKKFFHDLIDLFKVGTGPTDVRVSIIQFGKGIYPEDGFNLTTYETKERIIQAVDHLPHEFGPATYTGDGIDYMSNVQLSSSVVRPQADRVGVVITDGQSTDPTRTKQAAKEARDNGIILIAVGVGKAINHQELVDIAGKESRVIEVGNYNQLKRIMTKLAELICYHEPIPTTPTPPLCPKTKPSNIYFVASPGELGISGSSYISSIISETKEQLALGENYSFHLFTGARPCSKDGDVNLDGDVTETFNRLNPKLEDIALQLLQNRTKEKSDITDVAVLIVMDRSGQRSSGLGTAIKALTDAGINVYVVKPYRWGLIVKF